jgi:hypothetical protein
LVISTIHSERQLADKNHQQQRFVPRARELKVTPKGVKVLLGPVKKA